MNDTEIQNSLNNPEAFQTLFINNDNLVQQLIEKSTREDIAGHLLENDASFNILIGNSYSNFSNVFMINGLKFCTREKLAAKFFASIEDKGAFLEKLKPETIIHIIYKHAKEAYSLGEYILNDAKERERFIGSCKTLIHFASVFEPAKAILDEKMADSNGFLSYLESSQDIVEIHKFSPERALKIVDKLLYDPAQFKRILETPISLSILGKIYPQFKNILGKKNKEEACDEVHMREIRKNAMLLLIINRRQILPFLPADILEIIVAYTNTLDVPEKKIKQVIRSFFTPPSPEAIEEKEAGALSLSV